jgi:hypothetical protein
LSENPAVKNLAKKLKEKFKGVKIMFLDAYYPFDYVK